ncbi:L,D-transpeptidase [Actinomadura parmotrematis]|uniref:L,D-transpeptidase family protein n=1 Tax=Actinomadura parmotrematis TaxID=2864039 RepID=A0ABS7FZP5_9ACTN|nr:Ig-like domain-containing protein [Actinomadura parmotrematis]MBW8485930.1 L,D-transpeptidase family protein [Actinomadura parmotrematis]
MRYGKAGRLLGGGLAGTAVLALSACSGGGVAGLAAADKPVAVTITPATGGTAVKPDAPVQVTAGHGKLQQVTVQPAGGAPAVTGAMDADGTGWKSAGNLKPDTRYTVTATAKGDDGKVTTTTSAFSTLKPSVSLAVSDVTPSMPGETVGVGVPIIVSFDHAVKDRAAVEKALTVKAEKPVEGAWRWVGNTQVIYRTRTYWPAHQKVTVSAKLTGVAAGGGAWGVKDITKTIKIGAAHVSTVNLRAGRMTVKSDGKTVRSFQVSGGSGETHEYTTTSGVHLTMEKSDPVTMESPGRKPGDPGYYKLEERYAVRISNSGEYVHESDPTAASHGCIHAGTSNAAWFFDFAQRGDVVKVTGTDRELPWDNGWGYWQLPFDQWKKGSALT